MLTMATLRPVALLGATRLRATVRPVAKSTVLTEPDAEEPTRHLYPRNSTISFAHASVFSSGSMWPAPGTVASCAFAIFDWNNGP